MTVSKWAELVLVREIPFQEACAKGVTNFYVEIGDWKGQPILSAGASPNVNFVTEEYVASDIGLGESEWMNEWI